MRKDIRNYVDGLYIICEDHEVENITSNPLDPRVANVILQNEVEKWRKKYEVLKESYDIVKYKCEKTKKNHIDTKQKPKQAENDLKKKKKRVILQKIKN